MSLPCCGARRWQHLCAAALSSHPLACVPSAIYPPVLVHLLKSKAVVSVPPHGCSPAPDTQSSPSNLTQPAPLRPTALVATNIHLPRHHMSTSATTTTLRMTTSPHALPPCNDAPAPTPYLQSVFRVGQEQRLCESCTRLHHACYVPLWALTAPADRRCAAAYARCRQPPVTRQSSQRSARIPATASCQPPARHCPHPIGQACCSSPTRRCHSPRAKVSPDTLRWRYKVLWEKNVLSGCTLAVLDQGCLGGFLTRRSSAPLMCARVPVHGFGQYRRG